MSRPARPSTVVFSSPAERTHEITLWPDVPGFRDPSCRTWRSIREYPKKAGQLVFIRAERSGRPTYVTVTRCTMAVGAGVLVMLGLVTALAPSPTIDIAVGTEPVTIAREYRAVERGPRGEPTVAPVAQPAAPVPPPPALSGGAPAGASTQIIEDASAPAAAEVPAAEPAAFPPPPLEPPAATAPAPPPAVAPPTPCSIGRGGIQCPDAPQPPAPLTPTQPCTTGRAGGCP